MKLITLFASFILIFIQLSIANSVKSSKQCAKELAAIDYAPPNPAKEYLTKLMDILDLELRPYTELPEISTLISIIHQFTVKYNCLVVVQPDDPAATTFQYYPGAGPIPVTRSFGSLIAGTYLQNFSFNYENFKTSAITLGSSYNLAKHYFNRIGSGAVFIIAIPSSQFTPSLGELEC